MKKQQTTKTMSMFLLSVLMLSFVFSSIGFVSAEEGTQKFADDVENFFANYVGPIAKLIVGDYGSGDQVLVKVLFFLIIFILLFYSMKKFPIVGEKSMLSWIFSLGLALILIRYFGTDDMIEFIWLPTGALGVALATILPFIIFLFFIESFDSRVIRKVGWSAFAISYLALALIRWDELAIDSTAGTAMGAFGNLGWFYVAIAVLSIIAMLLDKRVRAMMIDAKALEYKRAQVDVQAGKLEIEMNEALEIANDSGASEISQKAAKKKAERIAEKIKQIRADVA